VSGNGSFTYTHLYVRLFLSYILLKITFNIITVTIRFEIIIIIIIYSTIIPLFNSGLVPRGKGGRDEKLNIHFHLVTRLKRMEIHLHIPTRLQDVVVN